MTDTTDGLTRVITDRIYRNRVYDAGVVSEESRKVRVGSPLSGGGELSQPHVRPTF